MAGLFFIFLRMVCLFGCFGLLVPILAATFSAGFDAGAIQDAADDRIAQAYVLDSASAQENHCVFLQIVAHAGNICGDFESVRKAHASDLADGGVRLLWSLGCDLYADAALEWRREKARAVFDRVEGAGEGDGFRLSLEADAALFCELVYCWHLL